MKEDLAKAFLGLVVFLAHLKIFIESLNNLPYSRGQGFITEQSRSRPSPC